MIAVIDLKMGNLGSILNMLKRTGSDSIITCDAVEIARAEKIILPGVGSFDRAMKSLVDLGLTGVLNERVMKFKTPVLGICLGMQIITKSSEEGVLPGLGWIDANTVKFKFNGRQDNLKVPHMGWNTIEIKNDSPLLSGMPEDMRFYFAHSYHVLCGRKEDIVATTGYGYDFVSIFKHDNITGVQFHPEKSHTFGRKLLDNFIGM